MPTSRLCSAANCCRLSGRRSTPISWTLLPFSAPRSGQVHFGLLDGQCPSPLPDWARRKSPPVVVAACVAGRLPAHFRSRLRDDAPSVQPRHGRCAAVALRSFHCQPSHPTIGVHLPASCGFEGVFQHLRRSCVRGGKDGLVSGPLPKQGERELSVCQAPTRRSALSRAALTLPQEISKGRTLGKRRTSAHHGARNIFCGVGRWCGNHFACNQRSSSLDFTDKSITVSTNMYVVDPTEESIQLQGSWTSCPLVALVIPFKTLSERGNRRESLVRDSDGSAASVVLHGFMRGCMEVINLARRMSSKQRRSDVILSTSMRE